MFMKRRLRYIWRPTLGQLPKSLVMLMETWQLLKCKILWTSGQIKEHVTSRPTLLNFVRISCVCHALPQALSVCSVLLVFFHKIDQLESMQQMLWFNCPALLSLSVYLCFVFVLLPTNFAFVA